MERTAGGRWARLREGILDSPESKARYERTKHDIAQLRVILIQIDAERKRVGLSKAALAREMGVNPSVVRRLFSSNSGNPTLRTLLEILNVLGMELEIKMVREIPERPGPGEARSGSREGAAA